jgi:hypothetical protein
VIEGMVALTGIEPDGWRFSPVQLGLTGCVFSTARIPRCSETPPQTADVTAQSQRKYFPKVNARSKHLGLATRFTRTKPFWVNKRLNPQGPGVVYAKLSASPKHVTIPTIMA